MNIFINTTPYVIDNPKDGDTYYFDNQRYNMKITLVTPLDKIRITLCLIDEYGYNVEIETSKGIYILNKDVQELVMIYDEQWFNINGKNLLPYVDNSYKQKAIIQLYDQARIGENLTLTFERGNTGSDGRYKMSNLIFIGACNYHSNNSAYNGEGAVMVYKNSNGSIISHHILTEGYDVKNGNYQGSFGKHVKIVDMGLYDLLIVSATTKVKDNSTLRTVLDDIFGYIYIYSYRKNDKHDYYFHRETKIPLPSNRITKDLTTQNIDDYLPHHTIFQIEPLDHRGILVSYSSKILYLYDLRDTENIITETNSTYVPEFIKIVNTDVYFSYNSEIKRIDFSTNLWTDPSSTLIMNTYNVNGFGKIVYPYSEGIVIISEKDFFDFDRNYQLKKRITFEPGILSFSLFESGPIRKYHILIDGTEINLYILDQDYKLILNDLFKQYADDIERLIRTDVSGETLFICAPNHTDLKNGITNVGLVSNYDLFFERANKNLSSLFPDFDIFNQTLVEEKNLSGQKHFYLEETFKEILPLISNRSNNQVNLYKIHPVIRDTGITMELNYDVSYGTFLSKYSKYFIYVDPKHSAKEYSYLLDESRNLYLGWSDNQMLSYNNSQQNEIYLYKRNNRIHLVLLGIGTVGPNKRWNIIESQMSTDSSQNHYDISMNLSDTLDMLQFIQFHKFVHNDDLMFIVHNLYSIKIIDYFSQKVYTKTFNRNITEDLFYIDSFKNLFHLYSITVKNVTTFYLTIYSSIEQYQYILLDSVKMDITETPYQILAQYYDRAFILLENYTKENGSIIVRRFDILQELKEKIDFEEINISNEFNTNKHVVDVEFYRDTIQKLILVNYNEKDDKIFQKTSQKIYTLPRLLKTKYQNFEKKDVRQLMVKEKKYVNYEQYKIKDVVPNVFFNIEFQKYFNNNIGIFVDYQFLDNKDLIFKNNNEMIILMKQNEKSFSRYIFRPSPNYEFQTHLYDKEEQIVVVTAKGSTGTSYIEIFDVSATSFVVQANGEATGISLMKKTFDKEICYETLDDREEIYISEEFDDVGQYIRFWTFSKDSNYHPNQVTIFVTLNAIKDTCFHRGFNDEYIMDVLINGKMSYFQNSGNSYIQKFIDIPSNISIQEPFDIRVLSSSFFSLINPDKSYLFVKNQTTNAWRYLGQQIRKLDTKHENTLELERYYFVDTDISLNPIELFRNTNINIQSPIFSDSQKRFYCIQEDTIYKITHPNLSQLEDYQSISSDGSTIYTQTSNHTIKKLIYLDHANQGISSENTSLPQFCPSDYVTNFISEILINGNFTYVHDNLGYSISYLYQPTKSRRFNTTDFPLIDVYDTIYVYESPNLYQYKLINQQYIIDSSKNITNYEIAIDSDETFFINSKFSTMTYKEINFNTRTQHLDTFISDIPMEISISSNAEDFMVIQGYTIHLFKESYLDYPNKYTLSKSIVPSNYLKSKININSVTPIFKVDWERHRIFNSYASPTDITEGIGATAVMTSNVNILTWNPEESEYDFHSDISGAISFGFNIELSKDGNTLFISEPRAPEQGDFKEGKIHMYQYDKILDRYILYKTFRSKRSKIGYLMRVSPSMDRIVTFGYQKGTEELELVFFYDLHSDVYSEISIKANVHDMVFLNNSNTLFVEEKIYYFDAADKRSFYLIEDVNNCPNIITKTVLPNLIFPNEQMMFELKAFGNNYILMDGINLSHIVQIKDYMMNYIASQARIENSKIVISDNGSTLITASEVSGKLNFYISW